MACYGQCRNCKAIPNWTGGFYWLGGGEVKKTPATGDRQQLGVFSFITPYLKVGAL